MKLRQGNTEHNEKAGDQAQVTIDGHDANSWFTGIGQKL
jgi:hypothetical protein